MKPETGVIMPPYGVTRIFPDHVWTQEWYEPEDYRAGYEAYENMILDPLDDGIPVGHYHNQHNAMFAIKEDAQFESETDAEGFLVLWSGSADSETVTFVESVNKLTQDADDREIVRGFINGIFTEDFVKLCGLSPMLEDMKKDIEREDAELQQYYERQRLDFRRNAGWRRDRVEITEDIVTERATRMEENLYNNYLRDRRERRERRNREV
jgi:hypothetical protein